MTNKEGPTRGFQLNGIPDKAIVSLHISLILLLKYWRVHNKLNTCRSALNKNVCIPDDASLLLENVFS